MTYTDAQLIELVAPQSATGFRFRLLNPDRSPLGIDLEVAEDNPPSIQVQTSRATMRTMSSMQIEDPPDGINILTARVQPIMQLANGSEYPLGIFMFGQQTQLIYTGREVWTPEMFDENSLLDIGLDTSFSCNPGDSVLALFDAIAGTILGPYGIERDYEVNDIGAAQGLLYNAGAHTYYSALSGLGTLLGALPPFFNNQGIFTLKNPPIPGSQPDHSYDFNTRIFADTVSLVSTAYKAPNQYIVTGSDVNGVQVQGVYNLPPSAPNSAYHTGRVTTATPHSVPGCTDNNLAYQIAYVDALTDSMAYSTATFDAAADPRHDIFDTVQLFGVDYIESQWTLVCQPGGRHNHVLTERF